MYVYVYNIQYVYVCVYTYIISKFSCIEAKDTGKLILSLS